MQPQFFGLRHRAGRGERRLPCALRCADRRGRVFSRAIRGSCRPASSRSATGSPLSATMRSPGCRPATAAGEPARAPRRPAARRCRQRRKAARRQTGCQSQEKVREGPASTIASRCQADFAWKLSVQSRGPREIRAAARPRTSCRPPPASRSSRRSAALGSNTACRCAGGPPKSLGPNPTANSLTRTPLRRATAKCPSSCSTTRTESITTKVTIFSIPIRLSDSQRHRYPLRSAVHKRAGAPGERLGRRRECRRVSAPHTATRSIALSMIPAISPKRILPSTNAPTATSFAAERTAGTVPPAANAR